MKIKTLSDNKGFSLVEVIIGIALLAIASIMLIQGFVTTANIVNRATLYKNASAVVSSTVELQEKQETVDANVEAALSSQESSITIKGKRSNGLTVQVETDGEIFVGTDEGDSELEYREFVPGVYDTLDVG